MQPVIRIITIVLLPSGLTGGILTSCARQEKDIPARMQEYMEAACRFWNFQGSVLAAQDGRVILKAGYGLADADKEIPNTPATKFLFASITKTFTAAAVLMLEEEGLLTLNDPVSK